MCNIKFPWLKSHGSIEADIWPAGHCLWDQFPWLKSHGSIEAIQIKFQLTDLLSFHDWKVMAPLKPPGGGSSRDIQSMFPWLKSHGSIEAIVILYHLLYNSSCFHDWKVMAPLKPNSIPAPVKLAVTGFHDWKVMAPLKLCLFIKHSLFLFCFHDWKVMAPLKLIVVQWLCVKLLQFPWLKSHGSIEAV